MREAIITILAIIGLTWVLLHYGTRQPVDDHVASEKVKKIMQNHGIQGMSCYRGICEFERDGKVVRVRL